MNKLRDHTVKFWRACLTAGWHSAFTVFVILLHEDTHERGLPDCFRMWEEW